MRQTISISEDFFCDGHCYLLTSASLGGSGLSAQDVQKILFKDDKTATTESLLKKGVCFPVCFEGDCALDDVTVFVLGDLTEREEKDWRARLRWKLNVPRGKLILTCGCLAEDLAAAIVGEEPDPNCQTYQVIDVPPAEYLVEMYAYASSMTVRVALDEEEDDYEEDDYDDEDDDDEAESFAASESKTGAADYIIRLTPLEKEPPLPEMESGWFEKFEFRDAETFKN